ncbi:hypothetical protein K439DRAFT_1519805 [Ramaria rubella]|nr:hypothetical protein K439DRAFT_1519805 [Ramaria rubella]
MVLFTSVSKPCAKNNDGTMLVALENLENYIHEADCVGLDGGYAKFIKQVVAKNENLHAKNFLYPCQKEPNKPLSYNETKYNEKFGIACLLLNIKKIVELGKIEAGDAHKAWLEDEFDYPKQDDIEATLSLPVTLQEKQSHMNSIEKHQKQLLDGNNIESDEDMEEESYEIDKIVGHKSDKNGI